MTDEVSVQAEGAPAPTGEPVQLRAIVVPPPVGELVAALARAQGNFGDVKKSKTADIRSDKGAYTYSYADLADVVAAIREALAAEEIAWGQDVTNTDKTVSVVTIFRKGEEVLTFGPFVLPASGTPQAYGAAVSYARRYALSAALGIASEVDDDAMSISVGEGAGGRAPKKATQAQMGRLHALGAERGLDHDALRDMAGRAGFESLTELTQPAAKEFMNELEKLPIVESGESQVSESHSDASAAGPQTQPAPDPTRTGEGGEDQGGRPESPEESPSPATTDQVPPSSDPKAELAALWKEAGETIGTKKEILDWYREEFKPERAPSTKSITADELRYLIAMQREAGEGS